MIDSLDEKTMNRRHVLFAGLVLGLAATSTIFVDAAQAQAIAGRHYQVLVTPQPVESGKKIEVLEFFSYACPHCYAAEEHVQAWKKKLPPDVEFRRIPATFQPGWDNYARTYFALLALKEIDRLHEKVFEAVHDEGQALRIEKLMNDFAVKNGIDGKKWRAAYKSFSVQHQISKATAALSAYKVTSVPTFIVDGKYMTAAAMSGGHGETMAVIDELIAKARKERARKG